MTCAGASTALTVDLMRTKVDRASAFALAATLIAAVVSADTGVAARDKTPALMTAEPQPALAVAAPASPSALAIAPAVETDVVAPAQSDAGSDADMAQAEPARSLADLVAAQPQGELSREIECLAGAIYFEAKSESLAGQLAVGRVIVARSHSGRFPASYCGVVFQPSQFSFVRGQAMPGINRSSAQWRTAAAVAQIAHDGSWESPVEGALFFHATHVAPRWRLKRIARIENHVFYR